MSSSIENYLPRPRQPKVPHRRHMLPSMFKAESVDDDNTTQAPEDKGMEGSPVLLTPETYRVERNENDFADNAGGSDGKENDSGGVGLSSLRGQNAPGFSTFLPATPDVPSVSKRTARTKNRESMAIEDEYPAIFLPLTRENLRKMDNDSLKTLSYQWKDNTVDLDKKQVDQMKREISLDVSKHFIAFGTSKCFGWAIKTRFPWLDCSTRLFKDLRWDAIHRMGNLKHGFLYEKIYGFLVDICDEFPDVNNMADIELVRFLGDRFDQNLAKYLWAPYSRVLDVEKTFADNNSLGAWCLRQVFLNMCIRMLPLIRSERAMNPTLKWIKKTPSGWNADRDLRKEINGFFDCLCIAPELSEVELEDFVWARENVAKSTPRGTRKRNASQIALD